MNSVRTRPVRAAARSQYLKNGRDLLEKLAVKTADGQSRHLSLLGPWKCAKAKETLKAAKPPIAKPSKAEPNSLEGHNNLAMLLSMSRRQPGRSHSVLPIEPSRAAAAAFRQFPRHAPSILARMKRWDDAVKSGDLEPRSSSPREPQWYLNLASRCSWTPTVKTCAKDTLNQAEAVKPDAECIRLPRQPVGIFRHCGRH